MTEDPGTAPIEEVHWRRFGDNPFGLESRVDLLSESTDVENWSESFFFQLWSPETDVGMWLHIFTVAEQPSLWCAQVFVYLPDGELIVDRSFGRPVDLNGPRTGNLSVRCEEPHRRWTIAFDGAGEATTTQIAAARIVGAGAAVPLRFDIEFTAVAPIWDLFDALAIGEQDWGNRHTQQGFATRGVVHVGDRRWDIAGMGYNDHSSGPRNFDSTTYGGDAMLYIVSASGRVTQGVCTWDCDGALVLEAGYRAQDGEMELYRQVDLPVLDSYVGDPAKTTATLFSVEGETTEITIEALHAATFTLGGTNHHVNGASFEDDSPVAVMCPIRAMWPDGETGYGNLERVYRPSLLGMTPRRTETTVDLLSGRTHP